MPNLFSDKSVTLTNTGIASVGIDTIDGTIVVNAGATDTVRVNPTQYDVLVSLSYITITLVEDLDTVEGIDPLINDVEIDQSEDGSTNRVVAKISQIEGENIVNVASSALPTGAATSANQDTLIAKDFATQTTLAQLLAKIISAPSTEAMQISLEAKIDIIDAVLDILVAKDFATQTTLATLLTQSGYEAKADIALTVLRDAILGSSSKTLTDIVTILAGILAVKIDQTTDGTTNRVVAKISQETGENKVVAELSGSNLKWTPLSIINTDVGTQKTIIVPANKEYWLKHVQIDIITTAAIGDRNPSFGTDINSNTNIIDHGNILPSIGASSQKACSFGIGFPNETAYSDISGSIKQPLPDIILQAGDRIVFSEEQAIDRLNDTLKYFVRVLQRSV